MLYLLKNYQIAILQGPTHLLLAAVDLPFLLIGQSEHGLPVFICQVQFILQQEETHFIDFQTSAQTIQ